MRETTFVTVGNFADPIAAELARAKLESAGINSHLADELTVALDWQLTNALGGIRLQVETENAVVARGVLRDEVPVNPAEGRDGADVVAPLAPASPREVLAERAAMCALLGWLLPPLQLYATWLFIRVWGMDGSLRAGTQPQVRFGVVVNVIWLLVWPLGWAAMTFAKRS